MKTTAASLLAVILLTTTQCVAQYKFKVEAQSKDISNNLDLKAVASIFGEAKDLQDFEMRLNDYDNQISNLDLNNDGEVDYLRVIETSENNVHLVVIQSVLGKDVFQDVATIVVEKNNNRTNVQVIGDPYLYGANYIVEPVYIYTPSIFSFFWGNAYSSWSSPYYWGYYPQYYHNRHPFAVNVYMSNVYSHINHHHKFYYSDTRQNDLSIKLHNSIRRNDYAIRFPEHNFNRRNENISNRQGFESEQNSNRSNLQTRPSRQGNNSGNRLNNSFNNTNNSRTGDYKNSNSNSSPTINTRPNNDTRNSEINRGQRENYQTPSPNSTSVGRPIAPVVRESTTRPTPAVNQPTRSTETKQVERKATESPREMDSKPAKERRSEDSNSNRR